MGLSRPCCVQLVGDIGWERVVRDKVPPEETTIASQKVAVFQVSKGQVRKAKTLFDRL